MIKLSMKNYAVLLIVLCQSVFLTHAQIPRGYKGNAFKKNKCSPIQSIPGRIELAYYDIGGEGIGYHDADAENKGAILNERKDIEVIGVLRDFAYFRENEGVDICYTRKVDYQSPNMVIPKIYQQYIGMQENGEWTNYTVNIKVAGKYKMVALYANKDNNSTLWLNNKFATKLELPVNTGNWHIWNKAFVGEIDFREKGLNLLTLKYNEGANLAYIDFILKM